MGHVTTGAFWEFTLSKLVAWCLRKLSFHPVSNLAWYCSHFKWFPCERGDHSICLNLTSLYFKSEADHSAAIPGFAPGTWQQLDIDINLSLSNPVAFFMYEEEGHARFDKSGAFLAIKFHKMTLEEQRGWWWCFKRAAPWTSPWRHPFTVYDSQQCQRTSRLSFCLHFKKHINSNQHENARNLK